MSCTTGIAHHGHDEIEVSNTIRADFRQDIQQALGAMQDSLRMVMREELNHFCISLNQCPSQLNTSSNIGTAPVFSHKDVDVALQTERRRAPNQELTEDTSEAKVEDTRHQPEPHAPLQMNLAGTRPWGTRSEQVQCNKLKADIQSMKDKVCEILENKDNGLLRRVFSLIHGKPQFKEPSRESKVARLIDSHGFFLVMVVTIVANIIYIGFRMNHDMTVFLAGKGNQDHDRLFIIMDWVFLVVYCVEIIMRTYVHRLYFFVNKAATWNVFELVLVLSSLIDLAASKTHTRSVLILRALRFLKAVKVLRVFRAIRFCAEMRLMLDAICDSVLTLVWCLLLFVLFLYVFAVLLMQGIIVAGGTASFKKEAKKAFGSVELSMLTLFGCVTGGDDWLNTYNFLSAAGPVEAAVFLFYMIFFVIVAMNVITSTFMHKASRLFAPDLDQQAVEKHRQVTQDVSNIVSWVKHILPEAGETITREGWKHLLEHEEFTSFLETRGIEVKDASMFLDALLNISGVDQMEMETFVRRCLKMAGDAKSIDMQFFAHTTTTMLQQQMECIREATRLLDDIRKDEMLSL